MSSEPIFDVVLNYFTPQLWSLLNFILPDIFNDLDSFQQVSANCSQILGHCKLMSSLFSGN
jgi:hypothetical protein